MTTESTDSTTESTAVSARMLDQFPGFPSLRGRGPVQFVRAISGLGEIGVAYEQFARSVLTRGRLSPIIRELVILRVAWLRQCEYIWGGHRLIARDVRLRFSERGWRRDPACVLAIAVTDQLCSIGLDEDTRAAAVERWGRDGLLEMAMVVGQYSLVTMAVEALALEREPKTPPLPASWPGAARTAKRRSPS